MRIALFGEMNDTAIIFLKHANRAGFGVNVLCPNKEKLPNAKNVRHISGDVSDYHAIHQALSDADLVVCFHTTTLTDNNHEGIKRILEGMYANSVKRFVGFGADTQRTINDTTRIQNFLNRIINPSKFHSFQDILSMHGVDWTILSHEPEADKQTSTSHFAKQLMSELTSVSNLNQTVTV